MNSEHIYDLIVIGAGPTGLMAACTAAKRGLRVLLCEKQDRVGKKLLASGGGRCNVTNKLTAGQFSQKFGKTRSGLVASCLRHFGQQSIIDYFQSLGTPLHAEDGMHFFPRSNKASHIVDALVNDCLHNGVTVKTGLTVERIILRDGMFQGIYSSQQLIEGTCCIMACGGKSYSGLGGSESGYSLAIQVGHTIIDPVPGLVALCTSQTWPSTCAGLTLDWARIVIEDDQKIGMHTSEGGFLFTHKGISGPAVLNISATVARMLQEQSSVQLRCMFQKETESTVWLQRFETWQQQEGSKMLSTCLARHIPSRLGESLIALCSIDPKIRASDVSRKMKTALVKILTQGCTLEILSTEGWDRAMVTSGGVSLDEIDHRTLESKKVARLYFAGELLDCSGPCGGFNITWCLSSGAVAGETS